MVVAWLVAVSLIPKRFIGYPPYKTRSRSRAPAFSNLALCVLTKRATAWLWNTAPIFVLAIFVADRGNATLGCQLLA